MKITTPQAIELHQQFKRMITEMHTVRSPWFSLWREVADYFLPRRYPYLCTKKDSTAATSRNRKMLNSTTTLAVRTLASGMMNGVTSPARPWFRLRLAGFSREMGSQIVKEWLAEVERRMFLVLAESNFYNSMAIMYLEWCTFGTAAVAIYEDFDDIIRCYNYALGEFYLSSGADGRVNRLARKYNMTLENLVQEFGEENLPDNLRAQWKGSSAQKLQLHSVTHLIEPAQLNDPLLRTNAPWREAYWLTTSPNGEFLAVRPLYENNLVTPRWELHSGDSYGTSPAVDCLGDAIELQHLQLDLAQARQKELRPPLIVDQQLFGRPTALHTGGITYASAFNSNFGAKKAYDTSFPFQEMQLAIETLEQRIRETCYNNLFNMISNLDTVRSATEIDARREEKLVHLGPVLERFENEGLDPALRRVFAICQRNDVFPEPPPELEDVSVEIQYVSVLSDAQRAVATVPIERLFTTVGQLGGAWPELLRIPDVEELIRQFAEGIGIKPNGLRTKEEVAELVSADQENQALAQSAQIGKDFAQGAEAAGNIDVGGGRNAVQALLGG